MSSHDVEPQPGRSRRYSRRKNGHRDEPVLLTQTREQERILITPQNERDDGGVEAGLPEAAEKKVDVALQCRTSSSTLFFHYSESLQCCRRCVTSTSGSQSVMMPSMRPSFCADFGG